jgi:hypothetical protein
MVHSIQIKDDLALVDGRLGETSLKVGHLFSRSFPRTDAWKTRQDGLPCALVVREIEAYRQHLQELSPGMTARLTLAGGLLSSLKSAAVIE